MRALRLPALAALSALLLAPTASGQGAPDDPTPGVQFNGLGRTYIQQTDLGGTLLDTDTTTVETIADGEFVLDLAVSAQPNRVTEVQGILRLRNEFGGFFGSGVTIEVRELWARGVVANALEYRLGDLDLALTPYTVFLPDADGTVNAPAVFEPQRERVFYEEFYTGQNTRRFQGADLDFGLAFDQVLDEVDVRGFLARLRPTDFTTTPTRLIAGGRVGATSARIGPLGTQATLGVNHSFVWDDLDSGNANDGIRNSVITLDGALGLVDEPGYTARLIGEGGWSTVSLAQQRDSTAAGGDVTEIVDRTFEEDDTFIVLGLEGGFPQSGIEAGVRFVNMGPDFFSAAAQSKRIDYTRALGSFNRIGNERGQRRIALFDVTRDPSVYTFRVEDQLMVFDPRYNNALPYGRATPNRRGVRLDARYTPDGSPLSADLLLALLSEIRGQGTTELRDFTLARVGADLAVAPLVGYARNLGVSLGLQVEQTSRGGEAIEAVDLSSLLIEAGLSAEVYDRLDVLLGVSSRQSDGREYVPQFERFNDIRDFPGPFVTDDAETLLGAGLRYRFRDEIYLTVQVQRFSYGDDATPDDDYHLDQVFALFSMPF
ncbi:MAG: hypothetical protein AAGK21_08200 [Bacteroidota bacterium]